MPNHITHTSVGARSIFNLLGWRRHGRFDVRSQFDHELQIPTRAAHDRVTSYAARMTDSRLMVLEDGRDLGWLEIGDPQGHPILAFHGTPGSRLQMAIGDDDMRQAGVRLVCVDRPGYGLSTFQPHRRLVDWPRDVVQLADHLDIERFAVMGVSGGGPHSSVCAALLGDRVTAAAVVSGVGPLDDPAATEGMMASNRAVGSLARRAPWALRPLAATQIAIYRRWPLQGIDLMKRQLPAADVALLDRTDVRELFERDVTRASRTTARAMVQDFEVFTGPWGFDPGSITIPVHIWQGDEDVNVPPNHARLQHAAIPGSVLHWLPGEGHLYCIDRMSEIASVLVAA